MHRTLRRVGVATALWGAWFAAVHLQPEGVEAFGYVGFYVVMLGAVAVAVGGVVVRRPDHRVPWWVLLAGTAAIAVASVLGEVLGGGLGDAVGRAGTVLGMATTTSGAYLLVRASTSDADHDTAVDGAIDGLVLTLVVAASMWRYTIGPLLQNLAGDGAEIATSELLRGGAMTLLPAALLALLIRLVFLHPRSFSAYALLAANATTLAAGTIDVVATAMDRDVLVLTASMWLGAYLLVALAASDPSMRDLDQSVEMAEGRLPFVRLSVLGAALLVSQLLLASQGGVGLGSVTGASSVAVTLLVLWRVARLVGSREAARRASDQAARALQARSEQQTAIAALGSSATSEMTAESLMAEVDVAVRDVLRPRVSATTLVGGDHVEPVVADGRLVLGVPGVRGGASLVVETTAGADLDEADLGFLRAVAAVVGGGLQWREAHDEAMHQAHHDVLTGLPNRARFIQELRSLEPDTAVGVLFCDLDRFKLVNDTHGHDAGDRLLVEVAERFRAAVRGDDLVARLAGDEFVVLVTGCEDARCVEDVAARVRREMLAPFDAGVHGGLAVGMSVGCAFTAPGDDGEALLAAADAAMYAVKQAARTRDAA